ncbi:meiosis initiator protein [Tachyglossus aculeatus]|uniref:meiosis initiator protein n=1 Tax=Tachyglossus aculeatus TaxID=9261 RepID=UPI0018F46786|nr:meiosis initiator protein [Tachyglossus aculeatus]
MGGESRGAHVVREEAGLGGERPAGHLWGPGVARARVPSRPLPPSGVLRACACALPPLGLALARPAASRARPGPAPSRAARGLGPPGPLPLRRREPRAIFPLLRPASRRMLIPKKSRRSPPGWSPDLGSRRVSFLGLAKRKKLSHNPSRSLQELASLLPRPLHANGRKLTKKEILLHVLRYIKHLQRSIKKVQAVLYFLPEDREGACAQSSANAGEELEDEEDLSSMGPKLVDYDSAWEEEEDPGTGPWLSTLTPPNSPLGLVVPGSEPPLLLLPARNCCATGCSAQDLGLSPSLFSSPSHLLSAQTPPEGIESVSQALFEDVCLSLSTGTLWMKDPWTLEDDFSSSGEEDGDCAWSPAKRDPNPSPVRPKTKRVEELGRRLETPNPPCPFLLKKKCVNGFIMFCRLNRRQYIRTRPGIASTTATKELAHLWRLMTQQERKPYCFKARRFSRLHNRIVRSDNSSSDEEPPPQKPFYLLLAEKAHCFPPPGTP